MLQGHQHPVFVALEAADHRGRAVMYYAQLILCFRVTYLSVHQELEVRAVVAHCLCNGKGSSPAAGRCGSPEPFESYRWAYAGLSTLVVGRATQRVAAHGTGWWM